MRSVCFKQALQLLLIALCCFLAAPDLQACNSCGGSLTSGTWGTGNQVGRNFLSLRYRSLDFRRDGYTGISNFDQLSLSGSWNPHERVQLLATLPVILQASERAGKSRLRQRSLGDASILARVPVFLREPEDSEKAFQRLSIGAGLKLPTGRVTDPDPESVVEGMAAGTGSWDLLAELSYQFVLKRTGIQVQSSYQRSGRNAMDYRFGDQWNGAFLLNHWFDLAGAKLVPYAGFSGEWLQRDADQGFWRNDTGGFGLYSTLGAEWLAGNWTAGAEYQQPIAQDYGRGALSARGRWTLTAGWFF